MIDMSKPKIAILFGGCSPEYEVSLQSAYAIITHIDVEKYEPVLIGISRGGEWFRFAGEPEKIKSDEWNNPKDCVRAIISPDRETKGMLVFASDGMTAIALDACFPVLHGKNGEDGTVQGLLALAGIPIIGCQTLASALCMDKDKAHKIAASIGVRVPRSFTMKSNQDIGDCAKKAREIGYPLFVKPVNAGSSFGISKVFSESELEAAMTLAFSYDSEVIVEETIGGFEIGCAVLGSDALTVGLIDEIELADGFFDNKEKYSLETSAIHVPARISEEKAHEAKETAKKLYKELGCQGFARVDMFLTRNGMIVFNEVNTIPGFTAHSRYPNMLMAAGFSFGEIVNAIIKQGIETESSQ